MGGCEQMIQSRGVYILILLFLLSFFVFKPVIPIYQNSVRVSLLLLCAKQCVSSARRPEKKQQTQKAHGFLTYCQRLGAHQT